MTTPEGLFKDSLRQYLDGLGPDCWYYCPVPMGYGRRGIPDFIICYKGYFLAPETKRAGGKSAPWQLREETAIRRAGGKAARITDTETVKAWIREIDRELASYRF